MNMQKNRAQSVIEYAVFISVLVAALMAMKVFMTRGVQEKYRQSAQVFGQGEQYEEGVTREDHSLEGSAFDYEIDDGMGLTSDSPLCAGVRRELGIAQDNLLRAQARRDALLGLAGRVDSQDGQGIDPVEELGLALAQYQRQLDITRDEIGDLNTSISVLEGDISAIGTDSPHSPQYVQYMLSMCIGLLPQCPDDPASRVAVVTYLDYISGVLSGRITEDQRASALLGADLTVINTLITDTDVRAENKFTAAGNLRLQASLTADALEAGRLMREADAADAEGRLIQNQAACFRRDKTDLTAYKGVFDDNINYHFQDSIETISRWKQALERGAFNAVAMGVEMGGMKWLLECRSATEKTAVESINKKINPGSGSYGSILDWLRGLDPSQSGLEDIPLVYRVIYLESVVGKVGDTRDDLDEALGDYSTAFDSSATSERVQGLIRDLEENTIPTLEAEVARYEGNPLYSACLNP